MAENHFFATPSGHAGVDPPDCGCSKQPRSTQVTSCSCHRCRQPHPAIPLAPIHHHHQQQQQQQQPPWNVAPAIHKFPTTTPQDVPSLPSSTGTSTAQSSTATAISSSSANTIQSRKRNRSGSPSRRSNGSGNKPLLLGIFLCCVVFGTPIIHAQDVVVNANQCKLSMAFIADLNKDSYLSNDAEYLTWLNRMPKPAGSTAAPYPTDNSMPFTDLPVALQTLYNKYATATHPVTGLLVWDIHGVQPTTEATSPEQLAALTTLCEQDYGPAIAAAVAGVDVVFGAATDQPADASTTTTPLPLAGDATTTTPLPADTTTTTPLPLPVGGETLAPAVEQLSTATLEPAVMSEQALAGCLFEMYTSDVPPADNILNETEFMIFFNKLLSGNNNLPSLFDNATSLAEWPIAVQETFQMFVTTPDQQGWNIAGSNTMADPSINNNNNATGQQSQELLASMCLAAYDAIAAVTGEKETTMPSTITAPTRPPLDVTICKLQMAVADMPGRDTILNATEYVTFVKKLAPNTWGVDVTVLQDLPLPLQDTFNSLATGGFIDITGAAPNQEASEAQLLVLETVCASTDAAINLALGGGGGGVTPPVDANNSNGTTATLPPTGNETNTNTTESSIPTGFDSATAVPLTIFSTFLVRSESGITAKVLNDAKGADNNWQVLEKAYQTFVDGFVPNLLSSISAGGAESTIGVSEEDPAVPSPIANMTQQPLTDLVGANATFAPDPLNGTVGGIIGTENATAPINQTGTVNQTGPLVEVTQGADLIPVEGPTPDPNVTTQTPQVPSDIFAQTQAPGLVRMRRRLQELTNTSQPESTLQDLPTADVGNTTDANGTVADAASITSSTTATEPGTTVDATANATDASSSNSSQPDPMVDLTNTSTVTNATTAIQPTEAADAASPSTQMLAILDPDSAEITRFEDAVCPDASSDNATCLVAFAQYVLLVSPNEDADFVQRQIVNLTQNAIDQGSLQQELAALGNSSGLTIEGAGPDPLAKTTVPAPTGAPQAEAPQESNEGKIMGMPIWGFALLWTAVGLVVCCGVCGAATYFLRGGGGDDTKKAVGGGEDDDAANDAELEGGLLNADGTADDDEDFRDELHADLAAARHQTLIKDAEKDAGKDDFDMLASLAKKDSKYGAGFQNEFDNVSASGLGDLEDSEEGSDDDKRKDTDGGDAWDASYHSDESSGKYSDESGESSVSY